MSPYEAPLGILRYGHRKFPCHLPTSPLRVARAPFTLAGPLPSHDPLPAHLVDPHPGRLAPEAPGYSEIIRRHAEAIAAGKSLYEDPITGLWVMTADVLWERACCDNGCRHCPHVARPGDSTPGEGSV